MRLRTKVGTRALHQVADVGKRTNFDVLPKGSKVSFIDQMSDSDKLKYGIDVAREQGTTSMLDIPINMAIGGIDKLRKNTKTSDAWYTGLGKTQQKLIDLDRKGGDYIAEKMPKMSKVFKTTDMSPEFTATLENGEKIPAYINKETHRLTAPIDKVQGFATPLLGVIGLSSLIDNDEEPSTESKTASVSALDVEKQASMSHQAATMLKCAAEEIDTLRADMEKSAEELDTAHRSMEKMASELDLANKGLAKLASDLEEANNAKAEAENALILRDKRDDATSIVKTMFSKGMIRRQDINEEIDKLVEMDDNSYEMLKKSVLNFSPEVGVQYTGSGMFNPTGEQGRPQTLKDAVAEYAV